MPDNTPDPLRNRRRLPHIHPKGRPIFVTFRLANSMPTQIMLETKNDSSLTPGQRFAKLDTFLDTRKGGPLYLRIEKLAEEVCRAIERGAGPELNHYTLHEYVVMQNHVHMLITPLAEMKDILREIKGVTACFANEAIGFKGKSFWQNDYYDHFCRDEKEFHSIGRYIAMNPVKAGFVSRPENWKWSSAARRDKIVAELRRSPEVPAPRPTVVGRTGDKSVAATGA
jgi:REP element-mobilizing transposase RayT